MKDTITIMNLDREHLTEAGYCSDKVSDQMFEAIANKMRELFMYDFDSVLRDACSVLDIPKTYDNKYIKEHEDEIFGGIDDLDYRIERAMTTMGRMRCPFHMADRELYDEMYDALCDWCDDNGLSRDNFDLEEIIF